MSHIEKEKLIKADIASIENRVRHAFNQGYDLGYKEGKANCSKIPTGSTTKNDLGVDKTDMIDKSNFSQEQYKADLQSAYDCGYAQAKNDLGVDCISRTQAQTEIEMNASRYTIAKERGGMGQVEWSDRLIKVSDAVNIIRNLPPGNTQEPKTGQWIIYNYPGHECVYCSSCKEEYYEDDLYLGGSDYPKYCPNCGARMVEPQESEG